MMRMPTLPALGSVGAALMLAAVIPAVAATPSTAPTNAPATDQTRCLTPRVMCVRTSYFCEVVANFFSVDGVK